MEKKLKSWQGWLLFGGTMVVVFVLGMIAASVNERHAEVTSVMNNKKTEITGIEARNDKFESNYPREYRDLGGYGGYEFQEFIQWKSGGRCYGGSSGNGDPLGWLRFL